MTTRLSEQSGIMTDLKPSKLDTVTEQRSLPPSPAADGLRTQQVQTKKEVSEGERRTGTPNPGNQQYASSMNPTSLLPISMMPSPPLPNLRWLIDSQHARTYVPGNWGIDLAYDVAWINQQEGRARTAGL